MLLQQNETANTGSAGALARNSDSALTMLYEQLSRHADLREAGWHSRGYLPHFDGREIPQFITCRLADSVP